MKAPGDDALDDGRSLRGPMVATLLTLLLHAGLAWWLPMPGLFDKYGLAARQYLAGTLPGERLMDFSPLYFHLSVLAERLVSRPDLLLQGLQIVLAAASVGLFYRLLRHRFSTFWATAAAACLAIDPLLLVYERILEPEAFQLFFLLAFMVTLDSRRSLAPWLAGGLAALCLATRPTFLPAFLALPLFYRWRFGNAEDAPPWKRAGTAALVPVVLVLVLLGWRAHSATGDWRSPAMNPGTVFFEGNNPLSRGTSAIYPPVVLQLIQQSQRSIPDSGHAHYRQVARADAGPSLTPRQVNAYWSEKAWSFLRDEPRAFLDRIFTKVLYALHDFRWHDVSAAWSYEPRLPFPAVPFALLAALALFGSLFEARAWQQSLLFYILGGVQLAVMVVFYVSARQRLAVLPAVIYFAVVAAERFAKQRRGRILGLTMTLALTVALWLPDAAMRDEAYRRQSFRAAEPLFDEARAISVDQPAAGSQRQIIAGLVMAPWWLDRIYPSYFPRSSGRLEDLVYGALEERIVPLAFEDSHLFDVASLALRTQDPWHEDALRPLLEGDATPVYRGGWQSSEPSLQLAQRAISLGQHDAARHHLETALQRTPGDPFVLAEMVALDGDEAARQTLLDYWSAADANLLIGTAQLRLGKFELAIQTLGELHGSLAEFRDGGVYLAAALAGAQRIDEGAALYLDVAAEHPEPILRPEDIIGLFHRWAESHDADPRVVFYAAQILHRHGDFEGALKWLDHLPPPPGFDAVWQQERRRLEANMAADARYRSGGG